MPKKLGRRKIKSVRGTVSRTRAVPKVGRATSMTKGAVQKLRKRKVRRRVNLTG